MQRIGVDRNLNTSHVKVKHFVFLNFIKSKLYLNTSHVKVKQVEDMRVASPFKFKYISC